MISFLMAVLLVAVPPCLNDGHNQRRSANVKAAFRHAHPCPGGQDQGSTQRCSGYVIDHRCPLECWCKSPKAVDRPENMQWQTTAQAAAKDRWEGDCARSCR